MLGTQHFEAEPQPHAEIMPNLYSLGQLAEALDTDIHALRDWERRGLLPKPTVYSAAGVGRKRRYTAAQYNGLIKIAIEECVADRSITGQPRANITATTFQQPAYKLWERLAEADAA
jgi:hypothetical protein